MRVDRLPADTVARLRKISPADLDARLASLAQWELRDGRYNPVPPGDNLSQHRGVRIKDDVVQMGLTRNEIRSIWRQLERLLEDLDDGKIKTF